MELGRLGGLICSLPGTFGVLVAKAGQPGKFLLCCSHVIAKCGQIDFDNVPDRMKVIQQPLSTTCDPREFRVGLLQKGFSRIVPKSEGDTKSDIALALLDAPVAATTTAIQAATGNSIRDFAKEHPSEWSPGMKTRLLGAMNPNSFGQILKYNGDTPEFITFPEVGEAKITGLVRYSVSSKRGDSGGAVVDDQNRLLGIHVAGATTGQNIGAFMPVGPFMRQNNLQLV